MRPRFHVPGVDAAASRVELPAEEAEHLVRVLRLRVGDEVDILDGRGGMWRAEVVHAARKSAAVRPLEPLAAARELRVAITLVMSVLKGDKMDAVIRDAVMLGVAAIQPIVSERAETSLAALERGSRVARWQRIAVSSAKQCTRAVVPPVLQPVAADRYWHEPGDALRVMCVEPGAAPGGAVAVQQVPKAESVHLIVGPEGGWSVTEVAAALETGAILMSLGSRTLRAEAAPLVALAALLTTWGEWT